MTAAVDEWCLRTWMDQELEDRKAVAKRDPKTLVPWGEKEKAEFRKVCSAGVGEVVEEEQARDRNLREPAQIPEVARQALSSIESATNRCIGQPRRRRFGRARSITGRER